MDHRLVDKPAFCVVGKALRVSTKDGENLRRIPQFWGDCFHDGTHARLTALASPSVLPAATMLGSCTDFAEDMGEFTYLIAVESQAEAAPDGLVVQTVSAATWAVFEAVGSIPEAIQTVWGRIWAEFFPSSPYKHGAGPDLELYPSGDPRQSDYRCEVWVPVVKE